MEIDPSRLVSKLDRNADMLPSSLVLQHHLAGPELRIVKALAQIANRRKADVHAVEPIDPFGLSLNTESCFKKGMHLCLRVSGGQFTELDQIGSAQAV